MMLNFSTRLRNVLSWSRSSIKDMLKCWGFSYTRLTLPSSVPIVRNKKRSNENEKWQKNATNERVFLYEDESHIRDYQALRSIQMWFVLLQPNQSVIIIFWLIKYCPNRLKLIRMFFILRYERYLKRFCASLIGL
jgi:hypothetical protein